MKKFRNLRRISEPVSMEDLILNERQIFTTAGTLRLRSGQAPKHGRKHRGNLTRAFPLPQPNRLCNPQQGTLGRFRAWRHPMPCNPEILRHVPLFALLDDEETAVLAGQVEVKQFAARQRIYKMGEPGGRAYIVVSGMVRVTTVDEDHQEVVVDEPSQGEFFGFASMLEETAHQSGATALQDTVCIEVDRHDIAILLQRKPLAGMDMLAVLGRQFHSSQKLVRV